MDDAKFTRIAQGLAKAAAMSADELAAKKGEDDTFVRIKRNNERLSACPGHDFEPDAGWRDRPYKVGGYTAHCRVCGGDMKMNDVIHYLRGFAHAKGGAIRSRWSMRSGRRMRCRHECQVSRRNARQPHQVAG